MATVRTSAAGYVQIRIEATRSDLGHRVVWPKFDLADAELVTAHVWHIVSDGNAITTQTSWKDPEGRRGAISMGRLIMGWGELGNLGRIDYRNGNPLDCRRANLRIATQAQILAKRRPSGGASAYKGVIWDSDNGKWLAVFRGKKLGRFDNEKDAARAFDEAARAFWGDDAYQNFPPRPGTDMTGAKARLLRFAVNGCLDTIDIQANPRLVARLRAALDAVDRWVDLPPEWIPHSRVGRSEPRK